jgi:hypothetical protein
MYDGLADCSVLLLESIAIVIQRLMIQASLGNLHVVPVWKSLIAAGVTARNWSVRVDRVKGNESMTIDLADCSADTINNVVATLKRQPFVMTVLTSALPPVSETAACPKRGPDER